jgi:enoyl-CoA hydratase/carnithine racemase
VWSLCNTKQNEVVFFHGIIRTDMRYAADDATFAIPPAKLGIGYPVELMPLLVKAIGASRVKDMIFRGRP